MSCANSEPKAPRPSNEDDEYEDAERSFQPKSPRFWLIMIGVYASVFLVALDRMVIATAIPSITDEFHSIEDIGWYGSAYMLTTAIFTPLFGPIYKLYSTKWVFLASIFVFEVGSALCGAAPSSAAFIVGRAIAGIGVAGLYCGGIMIMVPLVPLRRRPMFNSFFGLVFGVSSALGPLIGGTFTDNGQVEPLPRNLTWRWCFYINLPIGGFTFVAVLLFLHLESPPREQLTVLDQLKRLDPLGLLFFVPSMVCLILALQWGGTVYPWSAPKIIGLFTVFAVLFVGFLAVEALTPETAMAPTRVVLNRSVGSSMLFLLLLYGGMMAVVYYLTIWFQVVQGQSALEAGIRSIPLVLSLVVGGIVAAVFTENVGYYVPAMLLSSVLCAIGGGMLSTLAPDAGSNHWIGYQLIYGFGIGCGFQTSNLASQNVLPRADVPLGVALMFFMQQLGGSVFLSVGQNIFSSQLIDNLSGTVGLNAKAIVNNGATALRNIVPPSELKNVIDAYNYALTRVFILAAALSACMIIGAVFVEWKSIKGKRGSYSKTDEANAESGNREAKN